jgi:alkylated DNA nucleotide flippase Atl1
MKKSWHEKLHNSNGLPKIEDIPVDKQKSVGGATLLIPAPIDVDAVMKKVLKGKVITTGEIRVILAKQYGAEVCCPLTTGIFTWIAANAAEEDRLAGKKNTTPWWRTLKTGGMLNPKYPGGVEAQKELLEQEGHYVVAKGKNWVVATR